LRRLSSWIEASRCQGTSDQHLLGSVIVGEAASDQDEERIIVALTSGTKLAAPQVHASE